MQKICSFSGHRSIPASQLPQLTKHLEAELLQLIRYGFTEFRAGGALGFDTLAAQTVLRLREQRPQIRLVLYLPCKTQANRWTQEQQAVYQDIMKRADDCIFTSESYCPGCMHKRNRALVDGSHLLLCYLAKPTGGTAYTVQYAQKNSVACLNLASFSEEAPEHMQHALDFYQRGMAPYVLLSVLREQPQSSYKVLKQLKAYDLPILHAPSFYSILFDMEQEQYILSIKLPCETGRRRIFLFLTAHGEACYDRLNAVYTSASKNLNQFLNVVSISS